MRSLALIWLFGMLSWFVWWGLYSLGKALCNRNRINLKLWAKELGFGAALINVVFVLLLVALYLRVPSNLLTTYSVLLVTGVALPSMLFRRKLAGRGQ